MTSGDISEFCNKVCEELVALKYCRFDGRLTTKGSRYVGHEYHRACEWFNIFDNINLHRIWIPCPNRGELQKDEIIRHGYSDWCYVYYDTLKEEHLINLCNFFELDVKYGNNLETFDDDDMLDI